MQSIYITYMQAVRQIPNELARIVNWYEASSYSRAILMFFAPPVLSSWASWQIAHTEQKTWHTMSPAMVPAIPFCSRILVRTATLAARSKGWHPQHRQHRKQLSPTASAFFANVQHGQKQVIMQMPQSLKHPHNPFPHSADMTCSTKFQINDGEAISAIIYIAFAMGGVPSWCHTLDESVAETSHVTR